MTNTTIDSVPLPSGVVGEAAAFAAERHEGQTRKGASPKPYITHPEELVKVLRDNGVSDEATLAAAWLHDTVEDKRTTSDEITERFGAEVAGLVAEMSDDKALHKDVRKALQIEHAKDASPKARQIKLADKIANLRDLASSRPAAWPAERIDAYFGWAHDVVAGLRGSNPRLEAAFDEAYAHRPGLTASVAPPA